MSGNPSKVCRKLLVLIDMDGVLADFDRRFLQLFRAKFPDHDYIPLDRRQGMYVSRQYLQEFGEAAEAKALSIVKDEDFFRSLPRIPGAVDALKEMETMDFVQPFLCTTSIMDFKYCVTEKFDWVRMHLGQAWTRKIVLTADKTVAYGDILIDDNPCISGVKEKPTWDHILMSSCHNKNPIGQVTFKETLENWTDGSWRDLLQRHYNRIQD